MNEPKSNGNMVKFLIPLVFFLAGTVLTGSTMVLRGDFLGRVAAEEVEVRAGEKLKAHVAAEDFVNKLILEELRYIRQQVDNP